MKSDCAVTCDLHNATVRMSLLGTDRVTLPNTEMSLIAEAEILFHVQMRRCPVDPHRHFSAVTNQNRARWDMGGDLLSRTIRVNPVGFHRGAFKEHVHRSFHGDSLRRPVGPVAWSETLRIITLSRQAERQAVARSVLTRPTSSKRRGKEGEQAVLELTGGIGVDAALEYVGTQQSIDTAAATARPGSVIGIVGVPHGAVPFNPTFFANIGWRGGPAPSRLYIPELMTDVLEGTIDPGVVLDYETDLEQTPEAYAAMDERRAIKSMIRVSAPRAPDRSGRHRSNQRSPSSRQPQLRICRDRL